MIAKFYTADDPGVVREVIGRIRVAGIQLYKRPTLLIDAIKKSSLQALYIPDRRRILLDESLPKLKHRWNEGHEIGHSIIPWHEDIMLGDNVFTLSRDCQEQVEAEANYAAGRLLFLRERFTEEARSVESSIEVIRTLQTKFGNTLSTTLYRVVESGVDRPLVGIDFWASPFVTTKGRLRSIGSMSEFHPVAGLSATFRGKRQKHIFLRM